MKKLPLIIMLAAAGFTSVAMAQTAPNSTSSGGANTPNTSSTEIGKDFGGYGKAAGAEGSQVSGKYGTNGAASASGMNGAAGTSGSATSSGTYRGAGSTSTGGARTPNTSSTEIGKDFGGYGKAAGASGSKVSPGYGSARGTTDANMPSNGAAGGTMMQPGSGMTSTPGSSNVTWTCPSGYTLSTATRDGTPLCYPSSGPMPGSGR